MRQIKRVNLIIAVLTALSVVGGTYVAYRVYRTNQDELINNRYLLARGQLLETSKESELNRGKIDDLFSNLSESIEAKSGGDAVARQGMRKASASQLAAMFESTSFGFEKDGNLQLELAALDKWDEYIEHLDANPAINLSITYKYFLALSDLRRKEPNFVQTAELQNDRGIIQKAPLNDEKSGKLLVDLNYGYIKHIDLMRKNSHKKSGQIDKDDLLQSFCWYYLATNNRQLTSSLFNYDERQFSEEKNRCTQNNLMTGKG